MARKKTKGKGAAFMTYNVIYEDGSLSSNRRIPSELLDQSLGQDLDDLILSAIEDQDKEIEERSGRARAKIKSISRA